MARRTTVAIVNKSKFQEIKIPLPPPDDQQRIVARIKECLGKVDEVEALRNQNQTDSHQLMGAIFNDHLNAIDGSAPEAELGDVLVRAQYGTSSKANTNGQGVPVLRMGNIQDGYLDATNLKHIELPANDLAKYRLNVGDVLINRTNSLELVGKSGLFDGLGGGDWVFASYLVRLEIDTSKALPGYINAMINSRIGRNYVNRTARRAIGMVNINVKEMKKMPVLLPDLDVQQSVVYRLDSAKPVVDRLIDEQKGDEVSALRESILHQAFSGEL